jgi:hypothetical protein
VQAYRTNAQIEAGPPTPGPQAQPGRAWAPPGRRLGAAWALSGSLSAAERR